MRNVGLAAIATSAVLGPITSYAQGMPLWANDTLFVTAKAVKFDVPPYLAFTTLEKVTKTA